MAQVHEKLRRAVLQGQFQPGERLVETRLAENLGISRTPIREALSKLEAEGLVKRLPAGGVVVGDVVSELAEIYGLRQRLEGFAARLAAERATDDELDEIEAACRRGKAATSGRSFEKRSEANRAFHRLLAKASHSPRLIRLTSEYYEYSLNDRTRRFWDEEQTRKHQAQHKAIVAALRARDPNAAEQCVYAHLSSALRVVQEALAADENLEQEAASIETATSIADGSVRTESGSAGVD